MTTSPKVLVPRWAVSSDSFTQITGKETVAKEDLSSLSDGNIGEGFFCHQKGIKQKCQNKGDFAAGYDSNLPALL